MYKLDLGLEDERRILNRLKACVAAQSVFCSSRGLTETAVWDRWESKRKEALEELNASRDGDAGEGERRTRPSGAYPRSQGSVEANAEVREEEATSGSLEDERTFSRCPPRVVNV
jgi:hypothetical protein